MENKLIEDVKVSSKVFASKKFKSIPKRENVPYIESNATIDASEKHLSILLINKHFTDPLKINLEIKGFNPEGKGTLLELTSNSPFDYNTIEKREKIRIKSKILDQVSTKMTVELSAHSVSVLKLNRI